MADESLEVKVGRMDERIDNIQQGLTDLKYTQDRANTAVLGKLDDMGKRFDQAALDTRDSIANNALLASRIYATKGDMIKNSALTGMICTVFSSLITYIITTHK